MFEHSVKVPRHYKIAANILKKVSIEGGSIKTLLYDNKLKHFRTNVLFALITETIKHGTQIENIFNSSGILTAEPRLDPWLAKVLTAEILYGKKALPGKSKPEQTILSYKDKFQTYINENGDENNIKAVRRPRYVRINTNLLTTSDAIRAFQDEGYKFIRCTSGSYEDYLQQVQNLTEFDFTQDYHVKTLFVFSPGTKLHDHELYHENSIILQDKATTLAVHLLAPPPGSVILDMCAAPGMKTTQLAAHIRNQGKIYAVERNKERYETLCDFVNKTGSKCVETLHKDALELKRGEYNDVEYVLLDPSCSGSGMEFCVHNYVEDARLARLTSLQEKFLKHAMNTFPSAKRIVYSTCSLFPEENERVITNVVKTSRAKWRVQDVKELLKGQWKNFGSGMYGTMGSKCLYARPETDLTTGFFMAVLDRDQNVSQKSEKDTAKMNTENKNNTTINTNILSSGKEDSSLDRHQEKEYNESRLQVKKNKKKEKPQKLSLEDHLLPELNEKKKRAQNDGESENDILVNQTLAMDLNKSANEMEWEPFSEIKKEKKHKKREVMTCENNEDVKDIELKDAEDDQKEIKKKKRSKKKEINNDREVEENCVGEKNLQEKKKRIKGKDINADKQVEGNYVGAENIKEKKKKSKKKNINDNKELQENCVNEKNIKENKKSFERKDINDDKEAEENSVIEENIKEKRKVTNDNKEEAEKCVGEESIKKKKKSERKKISDDKEVEENTVGEENIYKEKKKSKRKKRDIEEHIQEEFVSEKSSKKEINEIDSNMNAQSESRNIVDKHDKDLHKEKKKRKKVL